MQIKFKEKITNKVELEVMGSKGRGTNAIIKCCKILVKGLIKFLPMGFL